MNNDHSDWREARRFRAFSLKQEGWKQKDIAEALGVSESAVSQWMKRAREGGGKEALRACGLSGCPPNLAEPKQLRRGKRFHERVQRDWAGTIEGAQVHSEKTIPLSAASKSAQHIRRGRMDLFVDKIEDFVTVVEIKSTKWNKVKNPEKLLRSHVRQVLKYVDKYLFINEVSVCAAIIYSTPPTSPKLKHEIEKYHNEHSIQVYWYDEDDQTDTVSGGGQ